MFLKSSAMESPNFFLEMAEECEVFCVKLILWSIVAQKGTNILIFYIFEYGAEYGAECSAEYGAEQYFINFNDTIKALSQRNIFSSTKKNRLRKEINRLLSREMSNIYSKITIKKNWRSQN